MPKKLLSRFMPHPHALKNGSSLKLLGERIHHAPIWHLNRRSASRAVMIGLFFAFMPVPFQMLPAAIVCIYARANLPLTIAAVWVTNPLTIGPAFYLAYKLGALLLDVPVHTDTFHLSWQWFSDRFGIIWRPLLLGSFLCAFASAGIGYTLVDLFWRRHTLHRWHQRTVTRNARS